MTNLKNIAAAFEAFIAKANTESRPVKGVTYKVEILDNCILVSATYDADIGYSDEAWCNLGDMPAHDKSYEFVTGNGVVTSYVEYNLSGNDDCPEIRAARINAIAQMAMDSMDRPDFNKVLISEFIDHLDSIYDNDTIAEPDAITEMLQDLVFDVNRHTSESEFSVGSVNAYSFGNDGWVWAYADQGLSAEQFLDRIIAEDMSWWNPDWDVVQHTAPTA